MKTIVIVQKGGDYKTVSVNNLTEADIYKKCGFRKPDNFEKRHEWKVKRLGEKFHIVLYARNTPKFTISPIIAAVIKLNIKSIAFIP